MTHMPRMRITCAAVCWLSLAVSSGVVAQSEDDFRSNAELLEMFDAGITPGIADLLGASSQDECLREARRRNEVAEAGNGATRYCAVNFYPDGRAGNREGGGAGRCEAVRSQTSLHDDRCKSSSTGAGVVTAPIYLSLDDPRLPDFSPVAPSWGDAVSACANTAAYIRGVWTAGPTTSIGRDISQLDCIKLANHAELNYCSVNFYPNPSNDHSAGDGIAGRCEGVQPPCEAVFSNVESIVSTAALPVDQAGGCEWTADTLPALFEKINAACCALGEDCESGPPTTCSPECHDIVLGAWRDNVCKEVMLDVLGETMVSFVSLCQEESANKANGGADHKH